MNARLRKLIHLARKRRSLVEARLLAGETNGSLLAKEFNVSANTISKDIRRIELSWARQSSMDRDKNIAARIAQLTTAANEAWKSWILSKSDDDDTTVKTVPRMTMATPTKSKRGRRPKAVTVQEVTIRHRKSGDPRFLAEYRRCVTEIAKIQGLYVERSEVDLIDERRTESEVNRDAWLNKLTDDLQSRASLRR